MTETRWCPNCRDELTTSYDSQLNCLWCGGPTGRKIPPPVPSLYTEAHLLVLRHLHDNGEAPESLAEDTFHRVGFENADEALTAIRAGWRRLGYLGSPNVTAPVAPRRACKEIVDGNPCGVSPLIGGDYCWMHEPDAQAERELARQEATRRARATKEAKRIPLPPFATWLREKHKQYGTWEAVGRRLGTHVTNVNRLAREVNGKGQRQDRIAREVVEAMLKADGGTTTLDDLYGDPHEKPLAA